ncbi:4-hydroxybenzoate octaprenyltransferase [Methylacidimicrobium tartarophylax]|uniref:4-hydroxybenzoate polyprenyltransferase n=1 Tax=Methylacidimicrobium tartarophylax TaxID=1041768 RepID=A0A5E6MFD0_9BACT|nr:4-hydroxybenzoate octaprenyltransferase [Methylacidimicrobium tartarophylax]VVM07697.1 4-hydroxybenzoate polyprenyltransferase [Methylacidimicrobium tartarophylax]
MRALSSPRSRIANLLRLIKFSHTFFALPFALSAMLVAARGLPAAPIVLGILICMVGARTAAMAFNRYVDWEIDRRNPRTVERSRLASRGETLALCLGGLVVFGVGLLLLNDLCRLLALPAVAVIFAYSYAKRFTSFCHALLGLALALAPLGAWAAVRGELTSVAPYLLAASVLAWTFGFDLIYALQDREVDLRLGLHSFPARFGTNATLRMAQALHGAAWLGWIAFGLQAGLSGAYWLACVIAGAALLYEHRLCRRKDGRALNIAFFEVNVAVSMLLLLGVVGSVSL